MSSVSRILRATGLVWFVVLPIGLAWQSPDPRVLLREGRTAEARAVLDRSKADDADSWYQRARSYLLDFHQTEESPIKRRQALALAMEALSTALARDANHIPSLRAKAVVHARAELLYYDPNLAYELANRVAKLEPNANAYILDLTEWMSGEVRFTGDHEHRVPHDPLLGLDRSIPLLERVIDTAVPYSPEESAGFFGMGKALSRRGSFAQAIPYFQQAIKRTQGPDQKSESLREIGTAYYRSGNFTDAASAFYQALQFQPSLAGQWMLKVALDQLPPGTHPPLPKSVSFREPAAMQFDLRFRDVAPALRINRFDGNGTCGWADFDHDGDEDLFLAGSGTFMAVFRNDSGIFTEVTEAVGLAKVPSGYSLNLIDYDNDGWLDLYVTLNGWSGPLPNRLYRNNQKGRFEDVTARSGAGDGGDGFVSVWGDLDNDGWLDIVIANGVLKDGSTPQVYRNNRNGTFTRVTPFQEPPEWGAIGVALGDYDKDGDLDILINGLNQAPNRLYRNDGNWKFTEVSRQAGVIQGPHNGFVCFFFDYDNDGWPDVLTTSLAPWQAVLEGLQDGYQPASVHPDANRLFKNNGNGTFSDVTRKAGLHYPTGTMGAGIADLDNDGYLDIYLGTGDPQLTRLEPNRLFRNNGDGTFADATRAAGFARPGNKGHGVTFIDIDNDGDLEVYAQLGGHYPGDHAHNAFYENLGGNRLNWLAMDLKGTRSNRFGIGAQITVRAGKWLAYREVKGSEGFGSTNPYRVHLGLGTHTKLDSVEIKWPGGATQTLTGVAANQRISVIETGGDQRSQAAELAKARRYAEAEPLFREVCASGKDPDACYFWSRTLYAMDRHEEALRALEYADARQMKVLTAKGQSNEALGRYAEAEGAYKRAGVEARPAYGLFLYRQGRMEEAAAVLADAGPAGALTRARALFQLGKLDQSLTVLQPLFGSVAEAHELASRIYYRKRDTVSGDKHAAQGAAMTSK